MVLGIPITWRSKRAARARAAIWAAVPMDPLPPV